MMFSIYFSWLESGKACTTDGEAQFQRNVPSWKTVIADSRELFEKTDYTTA